MSFSSGAASAGTCNRSSVVRPGPVKICFIVGTLGIGGAERHVVEVVKRLDRRLFAPHVCVLSGGGPLQAEIEALGIPVEVLGLPELKLRNPASPLLAALCCLRFARLLRRRRFQIVHAYLFWAYVLGAPAARMAGVPVMIESRRSLGNFKADRPHYLWLERHTNPLADLIVPNSQGVKQDVMRQEGVPETRLRVIYNGVDAARYAVHVDKAAKRAELKLPPGGPVAAVVANLIGYKGHVYLLEAVEALVPLHPDLRVLLIGDGPMRDEIRSFVAARQLGRNVFLVGQRSDTPELLALADISILPSLEEGFSNALLESMAAGKAIVATDVGGNPEAIEHERSGILVPPADSKALAAAIGRLLDDPGLRARLGDAARRRAVEVFSMGAMMTEMTAMYRELLDAKGPRRA